MIRHVPGPDAAAQPSRTFAAGTDYAAGDRTLRPVDEATARALPALPGDDLGRAVVRVGAVDFIDEWRRVLDKRSGRWVEVRRADCGGGCRCAGEVRLYGAPLVPHVASGVDVGETLGVLRTAATEGVGLSLDWQHVAALDEYLAARRAYPAADRTG